MSALRDNYKRGSVGDYLREKIKPNSILSFVSAYFTIYAYEKLKSELDSIQELRFLFGDPESAKNLDPLKDKQKVFGIENEIITIKNQIDQKAVARDCANWIDTKVQIRSIREKGFLHGKMYHIENAGVKEAILGSSNFTVKGLGLSNRPNIELNLEVLYKTDTEELKKWFDEIWDDETLVRDEKETVLTYLAQYYTENPPEFIYYKTLYHIFEKFLAEQDKGGLLDKQIGFFETEIWNMLYRFQQDGVKGAINKILKHNGCIIADSVGLGKTFEALAVIQYFEKLNKNVLVLCPKKLSDNWTLYQSSKNNSLNPFKKDRFNYHILYHTDLGRITGKSDADGQLFENFDWNVYDLVVIDESHNFRGNPLDKVKDNGDVRMNRAKWLMERIVKTGVKTKVLLLSATPVNNNLRDLRNQILLITEGKKDALLGSTQIKDIEQTLKNAQTQFTNWADHKRNPKRNIKQLLERLDSAFFKLLDEVTIARSRKHIKLFYNLDSVGKFSERLKPHSIYPAIDLKDRFFTYDELNKKILGYKLSVFSPSAYLRDDEEVRKKYEAQGTQQVLSFTQKDRESFLIGMMKVNYLKRLESSIESFEISIDRTIKKIDTLKEKITAFKKSKQISQEEDLSALQPDESELDEDSEENDQWQVGKKLKFDLADIELDIWLKDLERDRSALSDIYNNAVAVSPERDAKLKELKDQIRNKINNPLNPSNKKVLIFTAFADTAEYLYTNLVGWITKELRLECALVAGSFTKTTYGRNEFSHILTNFSPIAKNRNKIVRMPQDKEIDIVIATDCISEGQNLQDCDFVINYDIHWNPVRIIQRFGRIDRLGTHNDKIQLVNFWPTKDLDTYINLKERVEARMALVDLTATGEDNILNTEQLEDLIEEDLKYRNLQLKRLQNEVLDLEEMNESISLTDFTLDDFRIELSNYLENNKKKLDDAPFGLYTVVPSPTGPYPHLLNLENFSDVEKQIIKPGVVFCLKQKGDTEGNEEVNPLQPYFLVYIWEDGQVRFNYTNAKQILEIYRLMCQGKMEAYEELCIAFNKETRDGSEMDHFTVQLQKGVDEIIHVFHKRQNHKLTIDRAGLLFSIDKQLREIDDFELVTWMIIK